MASTSGRAPRAPPRLGWKGARDAPRFDGDHAPPAEDPTRVTEIPEHLLKRSKERRSAIGGDDSPADADAPTGEAVVAAPAAAAVPAAAAAALEVAPEPPKPPRPEVAAALSRKKIPLWAMPVLAALPLWAYVYQRTLEPPPAAENDPFVLGEAVYTGCQSCHGVDGGGISAPALDNVLVQWPDYRDQIMWIKLGSEQWYEISGEKVYGANDTPTSNSPMPGWGDALTDEQIAEVVLYERTAFGGLDPTSEEYLALVEVAEGTKTLEDIGLGELSIAAGIDEASLAAG